MSIYTSPHVVIAVAVVFPLLAAIAVSLRLWARRAQKMRLMIDDFLMCPALLCSIGLGTCMVIGVAGKAFGYHTPAPNVEGDDGYLYSLSPEGILSSKLIYALQVLATIALGTTKMSILFFYRRIFCADIISGILSKVTLGLNVFLVIWICAFLVGFIFDCGLHFWANWGPLINDYSYCYSTFGLTAAFTITDVFSDLMIFLIPIRTLHLGLGQSIAVTGIFMFGALTIVTSVLRLILFAEWYYDGKSILRDIIVIYTQMIFWITITSSLGVITACLPTIQVLLRKLPLAGVKDSFHTLRSRFGKSSSAEGSTRVTGDFSNNEQSKTNSKMCQTEPMIHQHPMV